MLKLGSGWEVWSYSLRRDLQTWYSCWVGLLRITLTCCYFLPSCISSRHL